MIYSLNGKLIYTDGIKAVVECGGVGYACKITYNTQKQLPDIGKQVFLYTYMNVREDAVDLFGFYTTEELDSFKMLISVNGVGPKAGLAILSELSPNAVAVAISSGDSKAITAAQGVGPKLAQRIVLELKDKVGSIEGTTLSADDISSSNGKALGGKGEAVSALIALGYSQSEAQSAVSKCDVTKNTEQIIKDALKFLF